MKIYHCQLNKLTGIKISSLFMIILLIQAFQIRLVAQDSLHVYPDNKADSSIVTLDVKTNPEGAKVIIGGDVKGITPLMLRLAYGKYSIVFRKDGFQDRVDSLNLFGRKNLMLYETLLNLPFTSIHSAPSGSDVFLDSAYIGRTPIDSLKLSAGDHILELRKKDFKDLAETITIAEGYSKTIDETMLPTYGYISFSLSPKDANISIDNKSFTTGDINKMKLKTGWHNVTVSHPILKDTLKEKFYVVPSGYYEYKAGFKKFSWMPVVYSAIVPGLGQINDGSYIKGSLEFLVTAGAGYILSNLVQKENDCKSTFNNAQVDYNIAYNERLAAAARGALKEAASNHNRARNNVTVAYTVLGAAYVINIVDVLLFNSKLSEIFLNKETFIPISEMQLFENGGNVNFEMKLNF